MQNKKKKKNPIKFSVDINKVEEMVDNLMDSMIEKVPKEKKPFLIGFTLNFDSEDLPVIEELKELDEENFDENFVSANPSEPLAEVNYFKKEVVASFELPKKIRKNELQVKVKKNCISVKSRKHNFFKKVLLKHKINPKKFSSNLNNSFLELTFKK